MNTYKPQKNILGHCRATVIRPVTCSVQFTGKTYTKVQAPRYEVLSWLNVCSGMRNHSACIVTADRIKTGICPQLKLVEQNKPTGPYFECAGKSESIHYANAYTINQVNAMIVQGWSPIYCYK
jgi:hypothetical protein